MSDGTKHRVLIDPLGTGQAYLGVIVERETGVVYEQQCSGVECEQLSLEGYYVPVGGGHINPEDGVANFSALRSPFHKGSGCVFGGAPSKESSERSGLPPERLEALRTAVESLLYSSVRDPDDGKARPLQLDESRLAEIREAWVPVVTSDGRGILTWPNCD